MIVRIKEFWDEEKTEAVIEIHDEGINLIVFSCPYIELPRNRTLTLFAFLTENIWLEQSQRPPQKTSKGFFSYRLTAQIANADERTVKIGNISIVLDTPLPGDVQNGDIVSFDVTRLEVVSV